MAAAALCAPQAPLARQRGPPRARPAQWVALVGLRRGPTPASPAPPARLAPSAPPLQAPQCAAPACPELLLALGHQLAPPAPVEGSVGLGLALAPHALWAVPPLLLAALHASTAAQGIMLTLLGPLSAHHAPVEVSAMLKRKHPPAVAASALLAPTTLFLGKLLVAASPVHRASSQAMLGQAMRRSAPHAPWAALPPPLAPLFALFASPAPMPLLTPLRVLPAQLGRGVPALGEQTSTLPALLAQLALLRKHPAALHAQAAAQGLTQTP